MWSRSASLAHGTTVCH